MWNYVQGGIKGELSNLTSDESHQQGCGSNHRARLESVEPS